MALLLVAVLATDNLSETESRAALLAAARLQPGKHPFTPSFKFKDALAAALLQRGLCHQIEEIRVSRTAGLATVHFNKSSRSVRANFKFDVPGTHTVQIEASIGAATIRAISADVVAIVEASIQESD